MVSYHSEAGARVAPATIEFNVPLSQLEIEENQRLAERTQKIRKQLAGLDEIVRARARQAGDAELPIHAGRNCDDFTPVRARFIRFTISATSDGSEPCLDELEIYGPDGKENHARTAGAKTTASSLLPGHASHQIHHLTDGRHGNSWSWISGQRGCGWTQIELPAPALLTRVVWSRDAGTPQVYQDRLPSQYEIAVADDGKTWRTVATHAHHSTAERWFSEHAERHLNADQRRQRQDLVNELEKLRR
jgi:hypothetical protein